MKRLMAVLVVLLIPAFVVGCHATASARKHACAKTEEAHIIFNPEWTGIPPFDIGRAAWPTTMVYSNAGEQIEYRETTIDRQGWSGVHRDQDYHRRFTSVRTGRVRR